MQGGGAKETESEFRSAVSLSLYLSLAFSLCLSLSHSVSRFMYLELTLRALDNALLACVNNTSSV